MSTAIKRRRGTTAEHATFTGLEAELTVDTTKDTVVVHDGVLAGGYPLLREDLANNTNVTTNTGTQTLTNKTLTSPTINTPTVSGGTLNNISIGATTASTGAFTNLSYTGTLTGGTGVVNLGSGQFVKDASGNVGIGASPAQTLHVKTSTSATPITLGVLSNATGLPALSFNGAYASTTMAGIYGNGATASNLYYTVPAGQDHFFSIADVTKMTLNSDGNIKLSNNISVGGATPTTSGSGITFPATQNASANANTLDDYEEGTWTPTVSVGTISNSASVYRKIGSQVTVWTVINNFSNRSDPNGLIVSGLPFTPSNSGTCVGSAMWSYSDVNGGAVYISGANNLEFYAGTTSGGYNAVKYNSLNNASAAVHLIAIYTAA